MDINLTDICHELKQTKKNPEIFDRLGNCIFQWNPGNVKFNESLSTILGFLNEVEIDKLCFIKTPKWNYVILNKTIVDLVDSFKGIQNLKSVFVGIKSHHCDFFIYFIEGNYDLLELHNLSAKIQNRAITFSLDGKFENFVLLIKILYQCNLIELSGYRETYLNFNEQINNTGKIDLGNVRKKSWNEVPPLTKTGESQPKVLLFGDSVGTNTVGLLYLASFLRRNGIEAYCQWNDLWCTKQLLIENLTRILNELKPDIVGVSIKWAPHMARALEICKIVKQFSAQIQVVVGGDSATYYGEEIIKYEYIDYVIQGEGELPLLKLCRNEAEIPNCVYKKNNEVIISPHRYVQNKENNSNIYLSHLKEIFVSPADPYCAPAFYIQPGKGCGFNCFYCAGNMETQKQNFKRSGPYLRDIKAVKNDIREAMKYTKTLLFDFEMPALDSAAYYRELWEGIDLANHHCLFYFWTVPSDKLVKLLTETFRYVYFSIDLCSLSEPHRRRLTELKVVKPQPTDEKLFSFLDMVNGFSNLDLSISVVGGLPYFDLADIKESDAILSKIISKYHRFTSLYWPRLYAEPGAAITCEPEKYQMISPARTFGDFLNYSKLNWDQTVYPRLDKLNYPLIRYQDEHLEGLISKFIEETQQKLLDFYNNRQYT